jgi:hypothetical protein
MSNANKTMGTCPACFRSIRLTAAGLVTRHGWSEQGGRRVGEHGRAWHTGPCFGAGWAPFEVSPAGTVAFLEQVVFPYALARTCALEHLSTLPALFVVSDVQAFDRGTEHTSAKYVSCPMTTRYRAGERGYEKVHARRVAEEQNGLERASTDGASMCARVKAWSPAETKVAVEKKGPIVHTRSAANARFTACGRREFAIMGGRTVARISADRAHVTCPKCLEKLAG